MNRLMGLVIAAGVVPQVASNPEEGSLRFFGGATDAGNLEIYHSMRWGTICAPKLWEPATADIACKQLGFGMSTGTFKMPAQDRDDARQIWLSDVECMGNESQISQCSHSGWGTSPRHCTHDQDLGIRCLACQGETCNRYRRSIRFSGYLNTSEQLATAMYAVETSTMIIDCDRNLDRNAKIECNVRLYESASEGLCSGARHLQQGQNIDLDRLLAPFHEGSLEPFVYGKELAQEYLTKYNWVRNYLSSHPGDALSLACLMDSGILSWNRAGIHATPLRETFAVNHSLIGLIKKLYLAPRMHVMLDLDSIGGPSTSAVPDATARNLVQTLIDDGVVEIDDFGLDIAELNRTIERAFLEVDPKVTSVVSSSMTTRVQLQALQPLINNSTINAIAKAYLGPDASLDGYKVVRLLGSTDGSEWISGLWHNDRAGRRLKLFVRLHDVSPNPEDGGHPTLVAQGSNNLLPFSIEEFTNSRMTDDFVRSEYPVKNLGGAMGGGFIFDTNTLHKGFPGGRLPRTTVVLEYHSARKCPIIQSLKLPIPCPSGDQHLVLPSELSNEGGMKSTCEV